MSPAELDEFLRRLPSSQQPSDGHQLARLLAQKKRLTAYQAQAIYQGKGRALTLGKYVILSKLGQGGMGIVFRAEHPQLNRIVALKVLSASGRLVPSSNWRFRREVRAAGLLQHPNIVTAYDADVVDGVQFLVMQYVDGVSLSQLVKERGPLPVAMAISCILQAAHGLEYAHSRGVVHRDIKPGNLLLDRDGSVKVLDMGLARLDSHHHAPAADGESTETGEIMGTADYMAPEQAAHMSLSDARADIYSLGCTLWYLMTGREPYPGANRIEKLVGHWEHPIPSLIAARPEAPAALEAALTKMLAKKPEDRYQTMTQVITDLERCRTAEAAAGSHTPGPVEDQELINFLQALPELPSDRELRGRIRVDLGSSGRQSSASGPAARAAGETGLRTSAASHVTSSLRRGSGPVGVGRALAIALAVAAASLLLIAGLAGLHSWLQRQPPEEAGLGARRLPAGPPPPAVGEGWTPLFNGTDLSGWRKFGQGDWTVDAGVLIGRGADGWLATEAADYRDFELAVEYRLPEGGASGIFLRAWHDGEPSDFLELQIADDTARGQASRGDQRTGALVGIAPALSEVNASPEVWHHVIARVQGTRVEVWFNRQRVTHADLKQADLQRPGVHARRSGCIGLEIDPRGVEFRELQLRRLPPH